MSEPTSSPWLPRWLFRLTLLVAMGLVGLVLVAPMCDDEPGRPNSDWARLLALFAHDLAVRQSALASAVGLYVTAFVFFRPLGKSRPASPRQPKLPRPPVNVVGA
jgi:hypothetical protein